jgi:hypothetical protein
VTLALKNLKYLTYKDKNYIYIYMNRRNSDNILELGKLISYCSTDLGSDSSSDFDTDSESSGVCTITEDNRLIISAINEFSKSISVEINWDMENAVDISNKERDEYDEYDGRVYFEINTKNNNRYNPFSNKHGHKTYFDGLLKFLSLKFTRKTFSFVSVKTNNLRYDHILWAYNYDSSSESESSSSKSSDSQLSESDSNSADN